MKKIEDMPTLAAAISEHVLTYHNGQQRRVYVTDEQFAIGSKIVYSSTDLDGNILDVNDAFIEASGWEKEELIGAPHYILRHPDMPKAAFADLWETISNGGRWSKCVKNLRKDGGFYWVKATVHATKRDGKVVGYQSARHKISEAMQKEHEALYAEMRAKEN